MDEIIEEPVVTPPIDMAIVFLSPSSLKDLTGYQRVNGDDHTVIGIFLEDGTEVTEGCSYKSQWQAEEDLYAQETARTATEAEKAIADAEAEKVAKREALKAENDALQQQIDDAQLILKNAMLKEQLKQFSDVTRPADITFDNAVVVIS